MEPLGSHDNAKAAYEHKALQAYMGLQVPLDPGRN